MNQFNDKKNIDQIVSLFTELFVKINVNLFELIVNVLKYLIFAPRIERQDAKSAS